MYLPSVTDHFSRLSLCLSLYFRSQKLKSNTYKLIISRIRIIVESFSSKLFGVLPQFHFEVPVSPGNVPEISVRTHQHTKMYSIIVTGASLFDLYFPNMSSRWVRWVPWLTSFLITNYYRTVCIFVARMFTQVEYYDKFTLIYLLRVHLEMKLTVSRTN